MNFNRKIVVVGAGSVEFGLDSLAGILRTPGLHGTELVLVDIDPDKARLVERLAHRLNREWAAGMKIWSTTERREALPEAGFVILSVATDRESSWKNDHELGLKFNLSHYSENGGPGGFAHATRNMEIILPILQDIESACADACLITFSNPLTRICTLIHRATRIKNVGICHGIGAGYWLLANILRDDLGIRLARDPRFLWRDDRIAVFEAYQEIAKSKYEIRAAGINHFTWMLAVRERDTGRDILPYVHDKMKSLPPEVEPLSQKMFQIFGLIPVNGDTHISEYVSFTSDRRDATWERFDIQLFDFEWANRRRDRTLDLIKEYSDGNGDVSHLHHAMSERAEYVIDSLLNNRHTHEEAINIPNAGYVANLPTGAIVEVPGMIDSDGVSGCQIGELPEAIAATCRLQLAIADLNVKAFLASDRRLVHQLFAIDPMIHDPDTAISMADAYIAANASYFRRFG